MKLRTDYGKNADEWFSSLDESLIPIASELRILINSAVPKVVESIRWGVPTYEKKWVSLCLTCR